MIDCFVLRKPHFPPENKANLLNGGASRVTVFNLLSLLMRCITVTGFMSSPRHAMGPFNTHAHFTV